MSEETSETSTTEAATTTPQETGDTKKYSDLYNKNKADGEAWVAERVALQKQVDELKVTRQKEDDASKTTEQLTNDLNSSRSENESLKAYKESNAASMKIMLDNAVEGLTDEQKLQVGFASEDPYKRLQFINGLKGQATTVVTSSQGKAAGGDTGASINAERLIAETSKGNTGYYREMVAKHGAPAVDKFIVEQDKN